jgi:hypothetical protein
MIMQVLFGVINEQLEIKLEAIPKQILPGLYS